MNHNRTLQRTVINTFTLLILLSSIVWICLAAFCLSQAAMPFGYQSYVDGMTNRNFNLALGFSFAIAFFVSFWAAIWATETPEQWLRDLFAPVVIGPAVPFITLLASMIFSWLFSYGGNEFLALILFAILVVFGTFSILRFKSWLISVIKYHVEQRRLKKGEKPAMINGQRVYLTADMVNALVAAKLIEAELPAKIGSQSVTLTTQMVVALVESGHLKVIANA